MMIIFTLPTLHSCRFIVLYLVFTYLCALSAIFEELRRRYSYCLKTHTKTLSRFALYYSTQDHTCMLLACINRPEVGNPTSADLDHIDLPVGHRLGVKGEVPGAPRESTARDVAKVKIQADLEVLTMNL